MTDAMMEEVRGSLQVALMELESIKPEHFSSEISAAIMALKYAMSKFN